MRVEPLLVMPPAARDSVPSGRYPWRVGADDHDAAERTATRLWAIGRHYDDAGGWFAACAAAGIIMRIVATDAGSLAFWSTASGQPLRRQHVGQA